MKSIGRHIIAYFSAFSVGQLVVFLAFAILTSYAVASGLHWKMEATVEQSLPLREVAESRTAWFESLEKSESGIEVSSALARPMNLPVFVHKPPGPLGQFSHVREDLYPSTGILNGFSNEALIFRRYELESPVSLMHGGLDLVLVVLVVMPLALCLLNYNHLASEREQGRLNVLLIQGARPSEILRSRTYQCSLPLLAILAIASIAGTFVTGPLDIFTALRLILWCGAIFVYWYFWVGVCSLVSAICATSINAALTSVSMWILVVVVLPSIFQFAFDRTTESADKMHLLAIARSAEAEALGTVDKRAEAIMAEHSLEIAQVGAEIPSYYRSAYVANASINDRVGDLLDQHAEKVRQDHVLLDIVQGFSPATAAFRTLKEVSGSGFLRNTEFNHQVRTFFRHYFERIGVATLQQRRLTLEEAELIGKFEYKESLAGATVLSFYAVVLIFAVVLSQIAIRWTRKLEDPIQ
ncbi:MAG: hypothetical protein OXG24_13895 [Gammaproteobacteria bacterium]|nr:hypothetical protein [Gammaproteobacteria bacterium]